MQWIAPGAQGSMYMLPVSLKFRCVWQLSMKLTDELLIKPLLFSGALDKRACNRHALCETSK